MSWDWDHYAGWTDVGPWDKKLYTDEWQIAALEPRQGDITPADVPKNVGRWGGVFTLQPGQSYAPVMTPMYPINIPIAYQIRFALSPAGPFTPVCPNGVDGVEITLIKSIDLKSGGANERFRILDGQSQPSCTIIARNLNITVRSIGGEGGANVTMQVSACPVAWVDCQDVAGTPASSYASTVSTFVPAAVGPVTLLAANAARAQWFVQNTSTNADMILKLGTGASFTGPSGTIILPRSSLGIYESPLDGYLGIITAAWTAAPNGGAIVTEGTH
jgi:hypothetical protein